MNKESYLNKIVERKKSEVKALVHLNPSLKDAKLQTKPQSTLFSQALLNPGLSIIAEVKRKSPSLGQIKEIKDPLSLVEKYCQGGASAISVLTDFDGFGGTLQDLQNVVELMKRKHPHVAVLRKDFIVDPIQLVESALAGASAVLLITSILGKELRKFLSLASQLNLESLTEVDDYEDLQLALEAGAPIIGINHRNLNTFEVNLNRSAELRPHIPAGKITVAESGVHTPEFAHRMRELQFDAVLVGEALIKSNDPIRLIRDFICK